jgi:hypothetical protein
VVDRNGAVRVIDYDALNQVDNEYWYTDETMATTVGAMDFYFDGFGRLWSVYSVDDSFRGAFRFPAASETALTIDSTQLLQLLSGGEVVIRRAS